MSPSEIDVRIDVLSIVSNRSIVSKKPCVSIMDNELFDLNLYLIYIFNNYNN